MSGSLDMSDILTSMDNLPMQNISNSPEADEHDADKHDTGGDVPAEWSFGANHDTELEMPDSIQQSIEALMHDTVDPVETGDHSNYQLQVCFSEDGVSELYASRATEPSFGADAGWDLHCTHTTTINPGETVFIDFGLAACCSMRGNMPVPLLLVPRSSISKTPLRMSNSIGLIDAGYRGNLKAAVDHRGTEPYTIERGDRLFQLVAMPVQGMGWIPVSDLDVTERGDGAFGSTGR